MSWPAAQRLPCPQSINFLTDWAPQSLHVQALGLVVLLILTIKDEYKICAVSEADGVLASLHSSQLGACNTQGDLKAHQRRGPGG